MIMLRGAIRVWGIAVVIRERNNYRPVVIHFDTVTGRDFAEKPVTLSDVTVTVPIPLLIPSGSWALSFFLYTYAMKFLFTWLLPSLISK